MLKGATRVLARGVWGALVLLMFALIAVITAEVVMRYVFGRSLVWSLEVSQVLFIWTIFLGASLAVQRRQFTAFDFLTRHFPPWWSRRVIFAVIVLFAAAFGMLAFTYLGHTSLQRLTMTNLPTTVFYVAPVVACILMVVFGLEILLSSAPDTEDVTVKDIMG